MGRGSSSATAAGGVLARARGAGQEFETHPDPKPGPPRAIDSIGVHHSRNEDIGHLAGLGADETLRSDTDDLEPVIPDAEGLSENTRVAGEPARPKVIA